MGFVEEGMARKLAVKDLKKVEALLNATLADLYDSAPGYAGEVESVKEAAQTAIKVLNGEGVD